MRFAEWPRKWSQRSSGILSGSALKLLPIAIGNAFTAWLRRALFAQKRGFWCRRGEMGKTGYLNDTLVKGFREGLRRGGFEVQRGSWLFVFVGGNKRIKAIKVPLLVQAP